MLFSKKIAILFIWIGLFSFSFSAICSFTLKSKVSLVQIEDESDSDEDSNNDDDSKDDNEKFFTHQTFSFSENFYIFEKGFILNCFDLSSGFLLDLIKPPHC